MKAIDSLYESPDQAARALAVVSRFPVRWDHRTLAVVFAGFCAFLGLYATQPLLPLLSEVFRISHVAVSLTVTVATLGVATSRRRSSGLWPIALDASG